MTPYRPTLLLSTDDAGVAQAAEIVRAGGLVAFPTETVYGLGAHALDAVAVRDIFTAKGRPANDPLIVHVLQVSQLERVARPTAVALRLAAAFWPGPLTVVLPKLPDVPADVTANLPTVAVRVPAHPVARALLAAADVPIAAPSANLFSRPSPTRAEHVLEDLGGRIDAVLDGGPTPVGVESTIVDLSGAAPRLLRPGGLAVEDIEAVLGLKLLPPPTADGAPLAPGLMATHYAPRTPLWLIAGPPDLARARLASEIERALAAGQRVGLLLLDDDRGLANGVSFETVGAWSAPAETAARLFDALRTLDRRGCDVLFAREVADPSSGLGRALADRLRRASQRVIEA